MNFFPNIPFTFNNIPIPYIMVGGNDRPTYIPPLVPAEDLSTRLSSLSIKEQIKPLKKPRYKTGVVFRLRKLTKPQNGDNSMNAVRNTSFKKAKEPVPAERKYVLIELPEQGGLIPNSFDYNFQQHGASTSGTDQSMNFGPHMLRAGMLVKIKKLSDCDADGESKDANKERVVLELLDADGTAHVPGVVLHDHHGSE